MAANRTAESGFGSGRALWRPFLRLSGLNILSNITVPLAGLVDVALLGHLAEIRHLAGVALASLLFDYLYWTFGFLRMSTTGLTAQAIGRGDRDEASHVLYRAVAIGLAFGLAIVLLQQPLRELGFRFLSGSEAVEAAGRDYFTARVWAAPVALVNLAFAGWFLGRGESGRLLSLALVANLSNVLLSYYLIVHRQLAATGAGLGSALAQCLMAVVAVLMTWRSNESARRPWRTTFADVFDWPRVRQLFALNRDILIRTVCLVSTFALFTNWSALMGTAVLAANSILLRLLTLASYLIDGAAFATESLAGYLLGRDDKGRIRQLRRMALAGGLGLAAAVTLVWTAVPRSLLAILTSHADVADLAISYLPWLSLVTLLGASAYILDGYFLGRTEGAILRRSMLWSTLAVFLPVAGLALVQRSNPLLWLSLALFMAARTGTLWSAAVRAER